MAAPIEAADDMNSSVAEKRTPVPVGRRSVYGALMVTRRERIIKKWPGLNLNKGMNKRGKLLNVVMI